MELYKSFKEISQFLNLLIISMSDWVAVKATMCPR